MASQAWSPDDVRVLERHLTEDDWLEMAMVMFPGRTAMAIKCRASKLRAERGIKGRRGAREEDQDCYNRKAVVATQRLLEATLRAGRWS